MPRYPSMAKVSDHACCLQPGQYRCHHPLNSLRRGFHVTIGRNAFVRDHEVGLEHRRAGVPLVCLETALPAKFEATIREALGVRPERPAGLEDLESLPRRVETLPADVARVKDYIARHADDRT